VIDAASTKLFGFARFTPGPGVGGHCLPIDPSYLSWRVRRSLGRPFRFVELANDVNDHMPDYVVQRLMMALNKSTVRQRQSSASVGLGIQAQHRRCPRVPALVVADRLLALGSQVRAADPYVTGEQMDSRILMVEATAQEVGHADAVVILTDHDAFGLEHLAPHARYIVDTRHCVAPLPTVEYL